VPASENIKTPPDAPKPNRRRAIVVTTVFALVLGSVTYYLWTNHAYLKWRFVGGEVELMDDCLETGYISAGQIIKLVNSGATSEIRVTALRLVGTSRGFKIPLGSSLVEAIRTFVAELSGSRSERAFAAHTAVMAIGRSGRSDVVDILELLAGDEDALVRVQVTAAFSSLNDYGDSDLGDEGWAILKKLAADPSPDVRLMAVHTLASKPTPEWAESVVLASLGDTDPRVRKYAVHTAASLLQDGKRAQLSVGLIRQILDSPTEDGNVRAWALRALYDLKLVDDDQLAAMLEDPQEPVVEEAKRLIKRRDEEREVERMRSSLGK
jgi:HEAT repeat protein